jgi:hypothetical protein
VPFEKWSVLAPDEREQMEALAKERRIAQRHGGWQNVDPSHLSDVKAAKDWLVTRRKQLWHEAEAEPRGWDKRDRRARYALLKDAAGN